jgi:predicted DNA-binding protein (MmcQ/YjbR family)
MSKVHWITVLLDGTVDDAQLKWLLEESYALTKPKNKRTARED